MNILILSHSSVDQNSGIVAIDLYNSLTTYGLHNVKVLTKKKNLNVYTDVDCMETKWDLIINRFTVLFNVFLSKVGFKVRPKTITNKEYLIQNIDQTKSFYSTNRILAKFKFKPDVIIVLFMQHFLSYRNLYELNKRTGAPILLYMMDLGPITGGCHYTWNCNNYQQNCGKCPALNSVHDYDQSSINIQFKKYYLSKTQIFPIVASSWQFKKLIKSALFLKKPKFRIILGIDSLKFTIGNKLDARNNLNLPLSAKVIFFGAVSIQEDKRKGYQELVLALQHLSNQIMKLDKVHLVIAGSHIDSELKSLPFKYTSLGSLNHEDLIRAYQASDVFVCPSIEEAGPMMINQSIMCGTPVVAFKMGVAEDLVISNKTGYLANLHDSLDLAIGISNILNLDSLAYSALQENCRRVGLERFSYKKQCDEFENVFQKIGL